MPNAKEYRDRLEPGQVVRILALSPRSEELGLTLGIVKRSIEGTGPGPWWIVYIPGLGDCTAWLKHIVERTPTCAVCGHTVWYWTGENPLFPDAIHCAHCTPPVLSFDERRQVAAECRAACLAAFPFMGGRLNGEGLSDVVAWPVTQRNLFILWVLLSGGFEPADVEQWLNDAELENDDGGE